MKTFPFIFTLSVGVFVGFAFGCAFSSIKATVAVDNDRFHDGYVAGAQFGFISSQMGNNWSNTFWCITNR